MLLLLVSDTALLTPHNRRYYAVSLSPGHDGSCVAVLRLTQWRRLGLRFVCTLQFPVPELPNLLIIASAVLGVRPP
jgi:hypothetical protein